MELPNHPAPAASRRDPNSWQARVYWIAGVLIASALMTGNVQRAKSLGMTDQPCIWVYDAIPPAVSNIAFGSPANYTSLKAVSDSFYASMRNQPHDSATIDRAIKKARELDPRVISRQTVLLGGDDKGIVDVVKIGLRLFNFESGKIVYVYFILLSASIGLFLLSFRDTAWPPLIAGFFLASHYMLLPMVFFNGQLQSVLALRYLPVLGLFASLHGLFFARRGRLSPGGVLALLLQVVILTFVLDLRSTTIWEVSVILLYALSWAAVIGVRRFLGRAAPERTSWKAALFAAVLPAGLALAGMAALGFYRAKAYDPRYTSGEQIATRPFWHNILSGFSFGPYFAIHYGFKVDDLSELKAVRNYLEANGRSSEWVAMGGTSPGYSRLRWLDYDPVAKELLVSLLRDHPKEFLATILCDKPVAFWHHLAWLYGFRPEIPNVEVFVSKDLGDAMAIQMNELQLQLDRRRMRFDLWNPVSAALVALFALLLAMPNRPPFQRGGAPFAALAAGSLIPTLVGYPGMHTIAEPALILPTALDVGAAAGLSCALVFAGRFLWRWVAAKPAFARILSSAKPGGHFPVLRWLFAGLVFMGLNTIFLKLLVGVLLLRPIVGTLVAGELSTLLRYLVNDHWVFGHKRPAWSRLWQYHLANAGALLLWWLATNVIISMGVNYLLAGILAIAFSTGFSMASNFYWIWRKKHHAPQSSA